MVELVIFDCDGVLVVSELLSVKGICEVLLDANVPATEAMIGRCFGMKQSDILALIAAETGIPIPPGVAEQIWPATRRWFDRELQPMPCFLVQP